MAKPPATDYMELWGDIDRAVRLLPRAADAIRQLVVDCDRRDELTAYMMAEEARERSRKLTELLRRILPYVEHHRGESVWVDLALHDAAELVPPADSLATIIGQPLKPFNKWSKI